MKISLDYDDTYTKDPLFWNRFISLCTGSGHEVMIVTYRDEGLPINHELDIPVFYTAYKSKRKFMENAGHPIDVWIDDSPETIHRDSDWNDDDRERWRQENHLSISTAI